MKTKVRGSRKCRTGRARQAVADALAATRRGETPWIRLRGERVQIRAADPARDTSGVALVRSRRFGLALVPFHTKDTGARVGLPITAQRLIVSWAKVLAVVVVS